MGLESLLIFLNIFFDHKGKEIIEKELHEREKLELRIENRIRETESRLEKKMDSVYLNLNAKIEDVRSELKIEIAKSKSDLIKWMLIFWTGTVITILGGLLIFLQLFLDK